MTKRILTTEAVEKIFVDCLFRDAEIIDGKPVIEPVVVDGIIGEIGFHPERLESHRAEVIALLNELPENFHRYSGDGWTFLNGCMDKHGNQWGEHKYIDQLFCLGMGLKLCQYVFPRDMWSILPGGMPYIVIDTD